MPDLVAIQGVGVRIMGSVTSASPGPLSCPGATASPDPDSKCVGMITRVALYISETNSWYVDAVGSPPNELDHTGEAYAVCQSGLFRSEFSQYIVNTRNSSLDRLDLRWGGDLTVQSCLPLTPPGL